MSQPPLILTAHVNEQDMQYFDELRSRFFPQERNFLRAHVTMFHKLPAEQRTGVERIIGSVAALTKAVAARVTGVRHLGSGVAFTVEDEHLTSARMAMKKALRPWLGAQDQQQWKPHITVQNRVHWQRADALFDMLSETFVPQSILVEGFDLWSYMNGPWRHERLFRLAR